MTTHDKLKHLSANLTLCSAKKPKKNKPELQVHSKFYGDFPKYNPDLRAVIQYYYFKIKEKFYRTISKYFFSE